MKKVDFNLQISAISKIYWYEYNGLSNNCNTIIINNGSCILIDPGHSFNCERLIQMMKKDLIDPKDIDLILNTHCHPDHCESNEIFSKISGARIGMHEIEANYLKNDARLLYEIFNFPFPNFKIDLYLKNSLKLNNSEIEIIHTPGHSPGSVCLYFNKDKTLICGDLIFERSFGRTDLPGGEPTLIKKSIERISNLDIELLLPGHGNYIKGKKNVRNNFDFIKKILNYI